MKFPLPALALALLAVTPAPAPATSAAPISISACSAKLPPAPRESDGPDASGKFARSMTTTLSNDDGLTIAYTNEAKVPATQVAFRFGTASNTITRVTDKGRFAPGARIKHRFALPRHVSILGLGDATCTVTRIVYADGTRWPK